MVSIQRDECRLGLRVAYAGGRPASSGADSWLARWAVPGRPNG